MESKLRNMISRKEALREYLIDLTEEKDLFAFSLLLSRLINKQKK